MDVAYLDQAIELLEKVNAGLDPDLLTVPQARERLRRYAHVQKLGGFGVAALARKLDDASEIARVTGTSMGKAKESVATGQVVRDSGELSSALQQGEVSLEQAAEIAKAEASAPGVAKELIAVAQEEGFHVLRDKARKAKLEAEQHKTWRRASVPPARPAATPMRSA